MELKIPSLNPSTTKWIWYAVLTVLFTISLYGKVSFSGILQEVSNDLCEDGCSGKEEGFIMSFYCIVTLLSSPIVGYLGDRLSKKYLMITGLCIWSGFLFLMTFMTDYWPFVIFNGLSAIGMRMCTNMSSAIIAELFDKKILGWIFGIYFLSIPSGLGLGMMVPSLVAEATGEWRDSLRITPGITLFCAIVVFFLLNDIPSRGAGRNEEGKKESPPSFWSDLKYLITNKSYVLFVVGRTLRSFCSTVLAFWGPSLVQLAAEQYNIEHGEGSSPVAEKDVTKIMGILTIVGGVVGLVTGSVSDYFLGAKFYKYAPLLIGTSDLLGVPLICASVFLADIYIIPSLLLYGFFICIVYIFMPWGQKIAVGVVLPSKRVLGGSLTNMVSNVIGSTLSPILFGAIIDWINPTDAQDKKLESIQLSFIAAFIIFGIGGICSLLMMFFFKKDREAVDNASQSGPIKETVDTEAQKDPDVENITQRETEETFEMTTLNLVTLGSVNVVLFALSRNGETWRNSPLSKTYRNRASQNPAAMVPPGAFLCWIMELQDNPIIYKFLFVVLVVQQSPLTQLGNASIIYWSLQ